MNELDNGVTHIAGPVVTIDGRVIQRCQVCGEKLVDSKNTMMPVNPDGTAPSMPTWEVGALVHYSGNYMRVIPGDRPGTHDAPAKYPDDGCVVLVED